MLNTKTFPSLTSFLNHGCVTTVCEGTRAPVAQTRDAVLVPAERFSTRLHLVTTVPVIDNLHEGVER